MNLTNLYYHLCRTLTQWGHINGINVPLRWRIYHSEEIIHYSQDNEPIRCDDRVYREEAIHYVYHRWADFAYIEIF